MLEVGLFEPDVLLTMFGDSRHRIRRVFRRCLMYVWTFWDDGWWVEILILWARQREMRKRLFREVSWDLGVLAHLESHANVLIDS